MIATGSYRATCTRRRRGYRDRFRRQNGWFDGRGRRRPVPPSGSMGTDRAVDSSTSDEKSFDHLSDGCAEVGSEDYGPSEKQH
jgi:hypothetical protein